MAYQAPYSGLAQVLAMQGRGPDTQLLHVTPTELRRLEAMAPNGRLPRNPETGLPEAGIFDSLGDIASIALPIAGAALLGPAIAPALGVSGLTGAAIGTGLGSAGAGLLQGKGLGESLIQGGLSGLMSYGLGSLSGAFAPSGGVTAATPDLGTGISDSLTGAAIDPNMELAAGLGSSTGTTAAAAEAPSLFTQLSDMASTPVMPETISSVLGPEKLAAAQFAEAMPTYGSLAGSGLSSMVAPSLLAPQYDDAEESPYELAAVDDYYYRIPDLDLNRAIGQSRARRLNTPPSYASSADFYRMASSPSGFGTFLAADGGRVPKNLNINGQPHELSYINEDEADLLRSLGGAGQDVMGIPAYFDAGEGTAGEGAPDDGSGVGAAADGSDSAPGAGMGVGGYSDAQAAAVAATMDAAIGTDAATMGVGVSQNTPTAITAAPPDIGMFGRGAMGLFGLSPKGYSVNPDMTYSTITGIGVPGIGSAIANAANIDTSLATITGPTQSPGGGDIGDDDDGVGDAGGDSGVYGRPYGDPYNTEKVQVAPAMAQGGVVQAGIGGLLKALSPAALTADTLGIADVDKLKTKDMLGMLSPAAFFAKDPKRLKYMSPAYMASQKPSALSPAATVMMNRGMAQGGGISSLAYGGDPAPVGFANKAFEGMVPGTGTGMSDDVPFSIEGQQPALLSRDEYVLPADVVSQLGDGSSGAGADMLDNFVSSLRQSKYGNSQQPPANGGQLMNNLMRQGGVV